jgi:hypothetical protein
MADDNPPESASSRRRRRCRCSSSMRGVPALRASGFDRSCTNRCRAHFTFAGRPKRAAAIYLREPTHDSSLWAARAAVRRGATAPPAREMTARTGPQRENCSSATLTSPCCTSSSASAGDGTLHAPMPAERRFHAGPREFVPSSHYVRGRSRGRRGQHRRALSTPLRPKRFRAMIGGNLSLWAKRSLPPPWQPRRMGKILFFEDPRAKLTTAFDRMGPRTSRSRACQRRGRHRAGRLLQLQRAKDNQCWANADRDGGSSRSDERFNELRSIRRNLPEPSGRTEGHSYRVRPAVDTARTSRRYQLWCHICSLAQRPRSPLESWDWFQ